MERKHFFIAASLILCLGVGGVFAADSNETNTPEGILKLPDNITAELYPHEQQKPLTITEENGQGRLPYGRYRMDKWTLERNDKTGSAWKLVGYKRSGKSFEIGSESYDPEIKPEPVTASLRVRDAGDSYSFLINLAAPTGESVYLYRDGKLSKAPTLEITNADKSFSVTLNSSYG